MDPLTAELAEALLEIVTATKQWNGDVEKIIGRVPQTWIGPEKYDSLLAKYDASRAAGTLPGEHDCSGCGRPLERESLCGECVADLRIELTRPEPIKEKQT